MKGYKGKKNLSLLPVLEKMKKCEALSHTNTIYMNGNERNKTYLPVAGLRMLLRYQNLVEDVICVDGLKGHALESYLGHPAEVPAEVHVSFWSPWYKLSHVCSSTMKSTMYVDVWVQLQDLTWHSCRISDMQHWFLFTDYYCWMSKSPWLAISSVPGSCTAPHTKHSLWECRRNAGVFRFLPSYPRICISCTQCTDQPSWTPGSIKIWD